MAKSKPNSPQTRFENLTTGHLFYSERHEVMAFVDPFPRMPLSVVVAPTRGTPGENAHFYDLDLVMQRRIMEVGFFVGRKILDRCGPDQRAMFTLEGFGVPDHAHVVHYAGVRGQGADRYDGVDLGPEAVDAAYRALAFAPYETELLNMHLERVAGSADLI